MHILHFASLCLGIVSSPDSSNDRMLSRPPPPPLSSRKTSPRLVDVMNTMFPPGTCVDLAVAMLVVLLILCGPAVLTAAPPGSAADRNHLRVPEGRDRTDEAAAREWLAEHNRLHGQVLHKQERASWQYDTNLTDFNQNLMVGLRAYTTPPPPIYLVTGFPCRKVALRGLKDWLAYKFIYSIRP